ncbi:MAG: SDR family oxidoreductase [Candidatus Manganitrophus sp. SB1]|nr:SDR family oxidoreductase [Candidatus Manganitrophus morganii]
MSKRVLITGGLGYLGGRIAVALTREPNIRMRLGSRKVKSAPDWLPAAETVAMDVLERDSLSEAMRDVQAVVHLAAMNENECVADPGKAVLVNTLGTLNVLQAAIGAGVERFIYFSTAHVYGAPLVGHLTEATLPRPIHPYAITHHAAEDFVLAAHDEKKITGIVMRLSNAFGAPTHLDVDRWTLLANDLCRQAVQTRKTVLRSSGMQQRDFIPLEDVGRAVGHLLGLTREGCGDGLFNLGGASSSIWEMTQRIAARCKIILGFHPEIVRPEPAVGEPVRALRYDCEKLQRTGFYLKGIVEQELDDTLVLCSKAWGQAK